MKASLSLCLVSLATSILAAPAASTKRQTTTTTPTVDLGYEVHQGTLNSTGDYYIFSNIPYAQQPVGDLRFEKSSLPTGTNTTVNDGGSTNLQCVQAYPEWVIALQASSYGVDVSTMAEILYSAAGQTESCLVLDVYVPVDIFNAGATAEAPVLFWVHGGGFTYGSKTGSTKPAGLLAESGNGIIIVSINYRLGVYGWLGGSPDITENLGLYDQKLAFQWAQEYISLFGGSKDSFTAVGESAGAASLLHQITAYAGAEEAPFQQAIIMSPAFQFNLNLTTGYQLTIAEASSETGETITTVAQLKNLTADQLKTVNENVVYEATYGNFNYGPAPDGTFVPDHPQSLLLHGKFDKSVKVMAQHTSNESVPFTSPTVATTAELRAYVQQEFPEASNETVDYLLDVLYPDVLDGTYPWYSQFGRAVKIGTEIQFACSTRFLAVALGNETYNSIFAYPPGYHAEDVSYLFFNGDTTTLDDGLPVNPTVAQDMQTYITTFTKTGDPNYSGGTTWPVYGSAANVLEYTYVGPVAAIDDMFNTRCDWIQRAIANGTL